MSGATVRVALRGAVNRLRAGELPDARLDATRLLAHVLARDAAWLLAHDDVALTPSDVERYAALTARRAAGEPIPYLVGSAGFFGRSFAVDANVLVPRPETEALVAAALECAARGPNRPRFCDVGTGSGAIALTLALERPDADVVATDVSLAALTLARRNAETFGIANRVRFAAGRGLRALGAGERFTCVVANLPYVRTADLKPAPDPTSFEPRLALDGGVDGLASYRELLADLPDVLEPFGVALFEAGPDTVAPLAALAAAALPERAVVTEADLAGHCRLVIVGAEAERRA